MQVVNAEEEKVPDLSLSRKLTACDMFNVDETKHEY